MTRAFAENQWEKMYAVLSPDPRAHAGHEADCRCFLRRGFVAGPQRGAMAATT